MRIPKLTRVVRVAKTVNKAAETTVGVVDHVQSKAKRFVFFVAVVIFLLIASLMGVFSGLLSLFV